MSDSVDLLITRRHDRRRHGRAGPAGHGRRRGRPHAAARPRTRRSPSTSAGRIDATDRVVAPGFIDLHSHGGLTILAEPRHEPKVRQGVTTEIVGVDGNGFAPFERREDLEAFVQLDSGLDGRPDIDYDWRTVADYLARYDGTVSVNVGTLVGNSQLRIAALGWDDVPADAAAHRPDARARCATRWPTARSGLSSGLDYPPGSYATTEELAALTRDRRRARRLLPHATSATRSATATSTRSARRSRSAGAARRPAHITHFYHRQTHPGRPEPLLALVDDARAEGLDVTFDTYPSEWASTRLLIQLPQWIQAGGPAPLKERLADRAARDRVRDELRERGAAYTEPGRLGGRPARRLPPPGPAALGVAHAWPTSWPRPATTRSTSICDLLLAEDLGVNQVTSGPWSETLPPFVAHPVGMVGTDSTFIGAKPSPRTYGSFPRILGQFVRDERPAQPGGGDPQDDRRRRPPGSACAQRGTHPRRRLRRPRRLRPGDGPQQRDLRRAAPVPDRHRARHRQRHRSSSTTASTPARRPGAGSASGVD